MTGDVVTPESEYRGFVAVTCLLSVLSLTLPLTHHLLQLRVSLITLAALIVAFIIRLLGFLMAIMGNNKVSAQLEIFFRWNPSGTFRNIPWYH